MLPVTYLDEFISPKILSIEEAASSIALFKSRGKKVGLCHGGFDLLHPGHIKHFESAKKLCDILVVSVTSDCFVSSRKGSGRPIFSDKLRAYSIAGLECVDFVVITYFEKAIQVLESLKPSYYIKGPDFIGKSTPGITAERDAIASVGGEMKYTSDTKLSTTEIINYIKHSLDTKELLLVIDRDGTLIEPEEFLGQHHDWRNKLRLLKPVVDYISYLQTKYTTTKVIATNQAGVARGLYDCNTVEQIHTELAKQLSAQGIKIDSWQYCPDVDAAYAELKKEELTFVSDFVKEKTRRKPNTDMVLDALRELKKELGDFDTVLVLGDREEDEGLAKDLKARFIDVKEKSYEELVKEFS